MSSIEEKLNTIREIQQSLSELLINMGQDQIIIESELAQLKEKWSDTQMDKFKGAAYVGNFNNALIELKAKISRSVDFLEHKYATLQSHRN